MREKPLTRYKYVLSLLHNPIPQFQGVSKSMDLTTKALEAEFKKIGRQESVNDPIVVAKFFNPAGQGTWYATEMYYVIKKDRPGEEPEIIEVEASKLDESCKGEISAVKFDPEAALGWVDAGLAPQTAMPLGQLDIFEIED